MDVSHHGGSAYIDEVALMDGQKAPNGPGKHSPNGVDSEVRLVSPAHWGAEHTWHCGAVRSSCMFPPDQESRHAGRPSNDGVT